MRKLILGAVACIAALSFTPAQADASPCTIAPGAPNVGATCEYDAAGPGTLTVGSPNDITVTVTYVCDNPDTAEVEICTRQIIEAGGIEPGVGQGQFAINSAAGDLVSIDVANNCVDHTPVCGHVGLVDARDN